MYYSVYGVIEFHIVVRLHGRTLHIVSLEVRNGLSFFVIEVVIDAIVSFSE